MSLTGVILAAGESRRMGRDKALLPWPPAKFATISETLLSSAIKSLQYHCEVVLVVAGNNHAALRAVVDGFGAVLVRNPNPELGQFSSLQTGLRAVLNRGRDNAMITLVDRPPPATQTLAALIDEFASREHSIWAVVPAYRGKHGHPFLAGREMIEKFLKAPANENARQVEHANQERITYLSVDDASVILNLDTPEDYASLESERAL